MSHKLVELFITIEGEQKNLEISDRPFVIGSDQHCDIRLSDDFKKISAVIKKVSNKVEIKTFDEKFLIQINNKSYKSAKFDKSIFLKLGNLDLIFNIEEHKLAKDIKTNLTTGLPFEDFSDVSEKTKTVSIQGLPDKLPGEVIESTDAGVVKPESNIVSKPVQRLNQAEKVKTEVLDSSIRLVDPKSAELEDIFKFNITFDEGYYNSLTAKPYEDKNLDFSNFIDPLDETIKVLPTPDIHKESKTKSLHISYLNNGVVLNDRYFEETKVKRLFLSKSYNRKNYIQAYDIEKNKQEFIFYRNNKMSVLCPEGYKAQKIYGEEVFEIGTKTIDILENERIVLSKGTSQIIIQYSKTPPSLKTNRFFNVDDFMLKSMAVSWAFALLVLGIVVAFPPVRQEIKEEKAVVIYKRKKTEQPEQKSAPNTPEVNKEEVEVAATEEVSVEAAPTEAEDVKKKTKIEKKIVKAEKIPDVKVKKIVPKKNQIAKAVRKKKRKNKLAKKKAPPVAKTKKFKFNFGNKMKTKLSKTSATKIKDFKNRRKIDLAKSVKTNSKITSDFDQNKIGATKSKISRFTAGNPSKSKVLVGTKGLSGKTKTSTAYIEETTKILGSIDPELVRIIMREYIPQFRHCYQRELITNPSVAGIFDIMFQINSRGIGINVGVKSKGKGFSKTGRNCLRKVVSLIKFPKPKGGGSVDVKQPMNFYKP